MSYVGQPLPAQIPLANVQAGLSPWAASSPPSTNFLEALRSLLPVKKSWSETEEYTSVGEYGSDVRLWWEDGRLENIEFRFNPYSDGWSLMQKFLAIVSAEACVLVETQTGIVLQPIESSIGARINANRSDAA